MYVIYMPDQVLLYNVVIGLIARNARLEILFLKLCEQIGW